MSKQLIIDLYRQRFGSEPERVDAIAGSGSNRRYYRLVGVPTVIGVVGESVRENHAFITMARHFASAGLPVAEITAISDDESAYLQTDLGSTSLFDAIASGRATGEFSEAETALLSQAMRLLARVQYVGAKGLDFSVCHPTQEMDARTVHWDLNYFKYNFLKPSAVDFDEDRLEDDFEALCRDIIARGGYTTFMYRDYQSRNVMVDGDRLGLIDFQGGRRGPTQYDVASFLWQAKANIPSALRERLIADYIEAARAYDPDLNPPEWRQRLQLIVLFRIIQVLGAYGFRGLYERKAHFIESIPPALRNLRELLCEAASADYATRYPELIRALNALADKYLTAAPKRERLCVRVMSFSYKRGLPDDPSGNGGGFIFDCRGMHNPGRYDRYKPLTGRDTPVIEFLEEQGEIQPYLQHCYALVDPSVATYLRRGFTDLMVCFGCTGGRHRSVYCAEHMAAHLRETFAGLDVELTHREQS